MTTRTTSGKTHRAVATGNRKVETTDELIPRARFG
jgi:hypothetical protein